MDPELKPLWDWIASEQGRLAVGGLLLTELLRVGSARRLLRNWVRTGRARITPTDEVAAETRAIEDDCQSNDAHVIALARVSGARLLCSSDGDLHTDFRNPALISRPRGSIYQTSDHTHLLTHEGQCPLAAPNARGRPRRRGSGGASAPSAADAPAPRVVALTHDNHHHHH